jgi:hypothetical protein
LIQTGCTHGYAALGSVCAVGAEAVPSAGAREIGRVGSSDEAADEMNNAAAVSGTTATATRYLSVIFDLLTHDEVSLELALPASVPLRIMCSKFPARPSNCSVALALERG